MIVILFFNHHSHMLIYTLSLHDALPIYIYTKKQSVSRSKYYAGYSPANAVIKGITKPIDGGKELSGSNRYETAIKIADHGWKKSDRKSTRLNSSHVSISYAVFCLKKKKK